MEDNLFRMFQYINLDPSNMMTTMLRAFERAMWEELGRIVNDRLKELASQQTGGMNTSRVADPFTILGVDFSSSEDEVRAAYRREAWKAHPDHGGSNEKMTMVNAAFEVICRFKGWSK